MHHLRIIAVFCLCLAASGQCVIWLETSWNLDTGRTDKALTDGFRWTGVAKSSQLNVEPGGVAGNNVMGIWLNAQSFAHVIHNNLPMQQYDDFYYRFYIKVYPKTGIYYPNFHGISNLDNGEESNFWFMVRDYGNANTWDCAIGSYAGQKDSMGNSYGTGGLAFNEWYRVEGHIHWYNHDDWNAPTRWDIRIYDSNNIRVRDENTFIRSKSNISLKAEYDLGKKFYLNGKTTSFFMGTNGPAGGTGIGRIHDVCAVSLGSDSSVWGPITGKVAVTDSFNPEAYNFYPTAGSTNVSASTMITLYLKETGHGLDTNSLIMRLNGQTVKPVMSGSIWNLKLLYKPPAALPAGDLVTINLKVQDKANPINAMDTTYSFRVAGVSALTPYRILLANSKTSNGIFYSISGQRLYLQEPRVNNSKLNAMFISFERNNGQSSGKKVLISPE